MSCIVTNTYPYVYPSKHSHHYDWERHHTNAKSNDPNDFLSKKRKRDDSTIGIPIPNKTIRKDCMENHCLNGNYIDIQDNFYHEIPSVENGNQCHRNLDPQVEREDLSVSANISVSPPLKDLEDDSKTAPLEEPDEEANHYVSKETPDNCIETESSEVIQYNTFGAELSDEEYNARKIKYMRTLRLSYWTRSEECKEKKWEHLEQLDARVASRESYILQTTLKDVDVVLEPNMFPYETPRDIQHWTLWSCKDMTHMEVEEYVYSWIQETRAFKPYEVISWNYDDNPERSIDIFHVHVYFQFRIPNEEPIDSEEIRKRDQSIVQDESTLPYTPLQENVHESC